MSSGDLNGMWQRLLNWWHARKYEREQEALALEETMRADDVEGAEAPKETYLSQARD
jgi:hypothetical protein